MDLPILDQSDFTGVVDVTQNSQVGDNLDIYITKYTEEYVREIFSDKAYQEIRDTTTAQKYLDLINGCDYVNSGGVNKITKGFKDILKSFIYYHFVGDNFTNMLGGNSQSFQQNAQPASNSVNLSIVNGRYNSAIVQLRNDLYPFIYEFENMSAEVITSVDNGDLTYTLTCDDLKYMIDGDTLTIGSTTYTAASVDTDDNKVTITGASTGLDFTGDDIGYEPYEDFNKPYMETIFL